MGFKQPAFISHSSRGFKSKIKVLADSISDAICLPGLQMAAFLLCAHKASSSVHVSQDRELSLSLLIKTLILQDQGPTLMISFNLNYFLRGLISKYSHIGG